MLRFFERITATKTTVEDDDMIMMIIINEIVGAIYYKNLDDNIM